MLGFALKVQESKNVLLETPGTPAAAPAGSALLEALTCELHWCALQIGGITSIMNASLVRGLAGVPNSCRNNLPVESPVVSAALGSWDDFGIPKTLRTRTERLFKDLSFAKQSMEPFIGGPHTGKADIVPLRAIAQLTAVWRTLSGDAYETVSAFEPETRWRIGGRYSENSLVLNRFLKEAIRGKFDCVDLHGEVVLPVLPQRRRAQRFALQQSCKVVVRGRRVPGFAQDISMYGIGLSCSLTVGLKEPVLIELQTGRTFKGTVAWTKEGRLGVQFDNALLRSDPLICS